MKLINKNYIYHTDKNRGDVVQHFYTPQLNHFFYRFLSRWSGQL